ncbi:Protein DJ-1-like protein B, partial [Bienertia sinuspersici]
LMHPNHGEEYLFRELNSTQWTFNDCPQILVPIADGSEEMEAVIIIDVLRQAKATVVVASVGEKLEILSSRKVKLMPDPHLDEAAKLSYDLIVLVASHHCTFEQFGGLGGAQAFAASEKLVEILKKQREASKPYGAICASLALVLEPHGLLK